MPFIEIEVPPGIVKSESDYGAAGRWIDCEHMRFVKGRPEKIGGVQKLDSSIAAFDGTARAAQAWASFTGIQCLAFGTACKLYLYREGTLSEITPYRADATGIALGVDPFAVVDTSDIVTVTDNNHGIEAAGTIVTFSGATAGGGITIDGDYEVQSIIDVNTYTIQHSAPATSTDATTGGAAVLASYELNCGNVDPEYLLGWGVGGWGVGYWGVDASIASAIISEPFNWAFDLYGEDLLVTPLNGTIYLHDTSAGVGRPAKITNAPAQVRYAFVTEERYIMALGCTTLAGNFDPMTVRWPDVLVPTDWTPADTNRANERKLQGGTRLMAGTRLGGGISMVWSDTDAFLFQFTGGSTSYASRSVGTACGLVAQHAWATAGGQAFWMGNTSFYRYAGFVEEMANVDDIKSFVFNDINREHLTKAFAFFNAAYQEVWFVYPGRTSTEPNRYVMFNLNDNSWSNGTWSRSAATSYTTGETRPIMFGLDGMIYVHEVTENRDNDGAALPFHIELAPTDVEGGNVCVDIFGFVPDCQRQGGDLSVYIYGLDHARDDVMDSETLTCAPTDEMVDARVSGRQVGMTISSNVIGGDLRLGRWKLEIQGAGKKRGSKP